MKTLDIIQGFCDHVFRDKKGNRIFPNIFVGKWEADLLEVTRSRLTYEYEVNMARTSLMLSLPANVPIIFII